MQLGVLRHVRLDEQCATLRVEPGRKIVDDDFERVLLNAGRVGVIGGQRVPIGDEEETVITILQADPIAQRADVVAEVQFSGGSHAAQNAAFFRRVGLVHQNLKSWFSSALKNARNGIVNVPTMEHPAIGRIKSTMTSPM